MSLNQIVIINYRISLINEENNFQKKLLKCFGGLEKSSTFATANEKTTSLMRNNAEIAQLVEHNLAKVRVASSSLVFRSKEKREILLYTCPGGGMVDALVSGASVERRASSSLVLGTKRRVRGICETQSWRNGGIGRRATLRG